MVKDYDRNEFGQISERNNKTRKIEKKLKNQKYRKKTEKSEKSEGQKKIRKSFEIQKLSCHFRRSGNPGSRDLV
jgi:hypothetical protein